MSDVRGSPPFLHLFGYIIYIINCMYNRIVKFVATIPPAALCFAICHNNSLLSTHLNGLSQKKNVWIAICYCDNTLTFVGRPIMNN